MCCIKSNLHWALHREFGLLFQHDLGSPATLRVRSKEYSNPLCSGAVRMNAGSLFVCLFVCLFHGVPVVCGGHRLTKDGPYATRRQAEAVLFVRRKLTPPFAGCHGNLQFRASRGLQTGRPIDHRPYSARHVGLLVEFFFGHPVLPSTPMVGSY